MRIVSLRPGSCTSGLSNHLQPPRIARALTGLVGALFVAGCSGPLVKSAITSNVVQEEAHNAYMLLNIARAQERMPMHFTQVTAVRAAPGGIGIGAPSVGLEIPFGGAAESAFTLTPSLEASSAVDTVSLTSQEFVRGVTRPVDFNLVAYFAAQGWPLAVLLRMFVGSVDIVDNTGKVELTLVNSPRDESFDLFNDLVNRVAACRLQVIETPSYEYYGARLPVEEVRDVQAMAQAKEAGLEPVPVDKDGISEAEWAEKIAKLNSKTQGAAASPIPSSDKAPPSPRWEGGGYLRFAKVTNTKAFVLKPYATDNDHSCQTERTLTDLELTERASASAPPELTKRYFRNLQSVLSSLREGGAGVKESPTASPRPKLDLSPDKTAEAKLTLRSTQSMIYFLGELSRAQGDTTREWRSENIPLKFSVGDPARKKTAYLFRMTNDAQVANPAVSVHYRNRLYSIAPYTEATDDTPEDRSVQTLALLSLVYGLQNHSVDAPSISNVRILNRR